VLQAGGSPPTDSRRCFWGAIAIALGSRVILTLVAVASTAILPKGSGYQNFGHPVWQGMWLRWDAGWYMTIAGDGYTHNLRTVAWFPLYPLLIRAVSILTVDHGRAGIVVSGAAFTAAVVLLWKLAAFETRDDPRSRVPFWTVVFLCTFPTSFYLSSVHTEALCLALMIATVYTARRRLWWTCAILGFLLALTRPTGVLIALAVVTEWVIAGGGLRSRFRDLRPWSALAAIVAPAIALGYYGVYIWRISGDPLYYFKAQRSWARTLTVPMGGLVLPVLKGWHYLQPWDRTLSYGFGLAATLFVIVARRRFDATNLAVLVGALGLPLSTLPPDSLQRYVVVAFPLYLVMGSLARGWKAPAAVASGMFLAQLVLVSIYANGNGLF
jgi:hypothetical protein